MPRVLVLDDEPMIGLLLRDWLAVLGCETVGPASSVRDALHLLDEGPVDAAILDVSLGDGDCAPVAKALRARNISFALATGHTPQHVATRFCGRPVLSKPFDFAAFRACTAGLLER